MLRKISFSILAISSLYFANAQDDDSTKTNNFKVSGYVDAYYRYNFNNAKKLDALNNKTSFTNSQNSFELGMASVKLEHAVGKVGVVADLGFGKRAEEFSYNDANTMVAIKQAYVTYAATENLKLTAGSWATHIGYELVDPYLNRNYSMSYMFSYGPFFHTGVKAEYTYGKSGFMLGIANPTDLKSANFSRKFLIGQYSVASADEKVKLYLNYQGGTADEDMKLNQFDAVVLGTITDKFSVGYNGTVQSRKFRNSTGKFGESDSWWGSALYLNVDPTPTFGLTWRNEYFYDKKDLLDINSSVFESTLSGNIRIDHLTIIPELRLDAGSSEIFTKNNGQTTKSTMSALMAVVYQF